MRQLLDELERVAADAYRTLRDLAEAASELDRLYIPTRYPNGLPDLTPDQVFTETMAHHAETLAAAVVDRIEALMR